MVIAAFSLRGYWRTLIERIAWSPAITITRFTTIARTGRRMKRSVIVFIVSAPGSPLGGHGRDLRVRGERVVHGHGHPVAQLEASARDDRLSRREPGDHLDEVPAPLAEADELLLRHGRGLAVRVLLLLEREHRVAVGREDRGGRGHDQHGAPLRGEHLRVREHARAELPVA